jgi:hypothetical protein
VNNNKETTSNTRPPLRKQPQNNQSNGSNQGNQNNLNNNNNKGYTQPKNNNDF